MTGELYMIKIGGSIITDTGKPQTARKEVIARLLGEISDAKKEKGFDIIIGHGSGSFGHVVAKQYRVNEGLINEESRKGAIMTLRAAHSLTDIVIDTAVEMGISLFPFAASSFGMLDNGRLSGFNADNIVKAMSDGFIPLVFGDVVIDAQKGVGIASTEEVLRALSLRLKPGKVILGSDIDGVFDTDPSKFPGAKLISEINGGNLESVSSGAGAAKKVDVTGGMKTKLALLYEVVKETGATGYIANAGKPGVIGELLKGKAGVPCSRIVR